MLIHGINRRRWSTLSLLEDIQHQKQHKIKPRAEKPEFAFRRKTRYFFTESIGKSVFVFSPDSQFFLYLHIASLLLILYQCFIITYLIAFSSIYFQEHSNFLIATDCFFMISIFLKFNTGFYTEGSYIGWRRSIFYKYFTNSFIFDLLSCFPLQIFIKEMKFEAQWFSMTVNDWIRCIWALKLFHVFIISQLFNNFQTFLPYPSFNIVLSILKHFVFGAIFTHWVACIIKLCFIKDVIVNESPILDIFNENADNYMEFLYLTFVTISTNGYGDIHPISVSQKNLFIFISCFGSWFFAFLISKTKEHTAKYNEENNKYRKKV
jgi:hypothetical protein